MPNNPTSNSITRLSSVHFQSLDGLRGIAVLMVVLFHLEPDLGKWVHLGYTGVALFFVLSGYLITGILIDSRDAVNYFSSFYARRALRIFPIYYATITFIFFVIPAIYPTARIPPTHDRILYFFYLNNWTRLLREPNNIPYVGHMWSLAVEEQFYWLWPFMVFKTSNRVLTYFGILGIFLGPLVATYLVHAGATQDSVGRNTIVALPTLMAGALCAIYLRRSSSATRTVKSPGTLVFVASFLTAFFVVASYIKHKNIYIGLLAGTGFTLALCLFLLSAIIGPKLYIQLLSTQILRRIGIYSYGIYVYHIPLFTCFDRLNLIRPGVTNAVCKMLCVFVFSALSYELVEKRINSYKSRFKARFKYRPAVPAS